MCCKKKKINLLPKFPKIRVLLSSKQKCFTNILIWNTLPLPQKSLVDHTESFRSDAHNVTASSSFTTTTVTNILQDSAILWPVAVFFTSKLILTYKESQHAITEIRLHTPTTKAIFTIKLKKTLDIVHNQKSLWIPGKTEAREKEEKSHN